MGERTEALVAAIGRLVERRDLSVEESYECMSAIMSGEATDAQIAAFITALRMKGETVDEITGCARAMRERAVHVDPGQNPYDVIDTCGTGGDVRGTFNISTAAALVAAGAGVRVAKHGNRSVSSHSGSADVLKTLGVNIEADRPAVERCLREANIGFLFAPRLHAAMKYAIGPRRELAIRTVFNILGPLTNPAGAPCQVLGVYDGALAPVLARVLRNLGSKHCFVVHAADGLDEISNAGPTGVVELAEGEIREYEICPEDFGLTRSDLADLVVRSPEESAAAVRSVLAGKAGPRRDIVLLNAAAGIAASGAAPDLSSALERAAESVDSGAAAAALEKLIALSHA